MQQETSATRSLANFFRSNEISYADSLAWTRLHLGLWKDNEAPPDLLVEAVDLVLTDGPVDARALDGSQYFDLHARLKFEFGMSHNDAIAFISHLRLAKDLAVNYGFSSARLTHVLGRLDERLHFSRQNISVALGIAGVTAEVSSLQIEGLYDRDLQTESSTFADADLSTGAQLVGSLAKELGYRGNLQRDLLALAPEPGANLYIPHLQMLHYQCCLIEFFDHSTLDLYEFNPRGVAANWLFARYPDNLASAGNPFLNNAKSVGVMDRNWVESKKPTARPGALALYGSLSSLDELSYAERREVAASIRAWIFLFLRLSGSEPVRIPTTLQPEKIASLMANISAGNTRTLGILEQRLVDCVSSLMHKLPEWRPRGISDSVNATNVSGRKLGDCDHQNSTTRRISAFESHGGKLTSVYIEEHIRTLRKIIPLRVAELTSIANVNEWKATVTFVAQEIDCQLPAKMIISGLEVCFVLKTFSEFSSSVNTKQIRPIFEALFLRPLQQRRTPENVRTLLLKMLAN